MPVSLGPEAGPNLVNSDKRLRTFEERLKRAQWSDSNRRKKASRCWKTYAGDPWPDGAKEAIERRDKTPTVNFNYVFATINTVLGEQMSNRREVQFRAIDSSKHDAAVAGWMTQLVRKFWVRANGARAESRAIHEQLVTGKGWLTIYADRSQMPPAIKVAYVPEVRQWSDPDATEDNAADGRFVIGRTLWQREDAIARWPDSKSEIESATTSSTVDPFPQKSETNYDQHSEGSFEPSRQDVIEVYDYQYRQAEPWVSYELENNGSPTGELREASLEDFKSLFRSETQVTYVDISDPGSESISVPLSKFKDDPKKYRVIREDSPNMPSAYEYFDKQVVYSSKILRGVDGSDHWLEKPSRRTINEFGFVMFNGFWYWDSQSGRNECFGLVEPIQEMQLLIAKVLTQTVQLITRAAKEGGFIRAGLLANPDDFQKTHGQVGKWHLIKKSATSEQIQTGIVPHQRPVFPHFHGELLKIAQNAIPDVTAVSQYLSGTESRERSNVLVSNLQSRALTTLSPIIDPVESGRVHMGRIMMKFIQRVIPDWMIDKILGEDGEVEDVTFRYARDESGIKIKNQETGEFEKTTIASPASLIKRWDVDRFHVSIDTGDASVTEKQATMTVLGQVMQTAAEAGGPIDRLWPLFFRSIPGLPKAKGAEIAEDLEKEMERNKALQTSGGIFEAAQTLDPEELEEVIQQLMTLIEQPQEQMA